MRSVVQRQFSHVVKPRLDTLPLGYCTDQKPIKFGTVIVRPEVAKLVDQTLVDALARRFHEEGIEVNRASRPATAPTRLHFLQAELRNMLRPGKHIRETSDQANIVMVQIEDESALEHLDAIAANRDVDMMFIGPADLSQSMGVDFPSDALGSAIDQITRAGGKAGMAIGLLVGDASAIPS